MQTESLLGATLADHEPFKLLGQLAAGLPSTTIGRFKRATGLRDCDVAAMLQIANRTLSRLRDGKTRLPANLSDRLYAVASVYALADDVFGDVERARAWLSEAQFGLSGRKPTALLTTEFGRTQVRALLRRIEHGFLA